MLEWRGDPDSGHHDPAIGNFGASIILICAWLFSSIAARRLQELGFANATDVIGGFEAWKDAGLPVSKLQAGLIVDPDSIAVSIAAEVAKRLPSSPLFAANGLFHQTKAHPDGTTQEHPGPATTVSLTVVRLEEWQPRIAKDQVRRPFRGAWDSNHKSFRTTVFKLCAHRHDSSYLSLSAPASSGLATILLPE